MRESPNSRTPANSPEEEFLRFLDEDQSRRQIECTIGKSKLGRYRLGATIVIFAVLLVCGAFAVLIVRRGALSPRDGTPAGQFETNDSQRTVSTPAMNEDAGSSSNDHHSDAMRQELDNVGPTGWPRGIGLLRTDDEAPASSAAADEPTDGDRSEAGRGPSQGDESTPSNGRKSGAASKRRRADDERADEIKRLQGWVDYQGRLWEPQKFCESARRITGHDLVRDAGSLEGKAVHVQGALERREGNSFVVASLDDRGRACGSVDVDATRLGDVPYRNAQLLQIWGIVGPRGVIDARFSTLLPPGVRWQSALRNPGGVVAGTTQTFHIDGLIKNTGSQPLRRVLIWVRMYQISSPNDYTKTFTIDNLAIGETRRFSCPFSLYNFQYIGASSVPRYEFRVVDYVL
jgi:hypothetical protein